MQKRKRISLVVTVSVPADMPVSQVRKEVRCLITEQCNWDADPEDVKAVGVRSAGREA